MRNFKYFLVKNKMIIIITTIILVCAISIAIGVYAQITNRQVISYKEEESNDDYEDLENTFNDIFTNTINKEPTAKQDVNYDEIIFCKYDIKEDNGNYNIDASIPQFKIDNEVTQSINEEIYNIFAKTIINVVNNSSVRTTFNLDYVVYANNNIVSLVLNCKYKDGSNPQRNIIKTYNYDIDNNKLLSIDEILEYKQLNREEVQSKISEKIKEENSQIKSISEQGYNVYIRNEDDEMYKIENTPNFFIGKNNYLYLVYAYGNNNYTSEIDLVIF